MIGQELSFLKDKIISYLYVLRCKLPEEHLGIFVSLGTGLRFERNTFDAYLNHVTALKKDLPGLRQTRTVASYAVTKG